MFSKSQLRLHLTQVLDLLDRGRACDARKYLSCMHYRLEVEEGNAVHWQTIHDVCAMNLTGEQMGGNARSISAVTEDGKHKQ